MEIKEVHRWDVSLREALGLQEALRRRLINPASEEPIFPGTIAGADIAFLREENLLFASVVALSYPALEALEEAFAVRPASFPYVPGLLSFREGPALLEAFARLETAVDAVIFDGQGIAHPRGIGLAAHLGLFLDLPTLGCAKKRLIGTHKPVGENAGNSEDLIYEGNLVGSVLRTRSRVKPVFVSPGHKIGLAESRKLVLSCLSGRRLPEPVRLAHLAVTKKRREYPLTPVGNLTSLPRPPRPY